MRNCSIFVASLQVKLVLEMGSGNSKNEPASTGSFGACLRNRLGEFVVVVVFPLRFDFDSVLEDEGGDESAFGSFRPISQIPDNFFRFSLYGWSEDA